MKKNSIAIYKSNCAYPIGPMVCHTRVILTIDNVAYRYEVLHKPIKRSDWNAVSLGNLYMTSNDVTEGLRFFRSRGRYQKAYLLQEAIVPNQEKAELELLRKRIEDYPIKDFYNFWRPNCNTFTQRVINQTDLLNCRLPFNAIGKAYADKVA